jgi:hypothetical protein
MVAAFRKSRMDIGQAIVALAGVIGVFAAPMGLMYMWTHRPAATREVGRVVDVALEARLERIELAVQAIALETERIAEGQRFTTKLLTSAPERVADGLSKRGA